MKIPYDQIWIICHVFEFYVTALLSLAHKVAQGFNQPCPPPRTLTMAINLTKAFHMVNHTKLIRTLSSRSINTERCLSAYLKGRTASCRYNSIFSPSFHSRVGVPQGACLSPVLFNIFVSTFLQSDDFITSSYADGFTISCSNSNVDQMTVSFCSLTNYCGVDRWAGFGHFCSKVHHHSVHLSICTI